MRFVFAILLSLLIVLWPVLLAAQVDAIPSPALAFTHVTVIDMTGAPPRSDMTVVVQGNRITALGPAAKTRIPRQARVIDATGKFLIPGLWDMHVHLGTDEFDKNSYLRLFIANGITGIRIMDGEPEYQLWRKEIEAGTLMGPRMVIASQVIGFGELSNIPPASAREEVRKARQQGADFIKVHDNILRPSYFALVDEARRVHLPVAGHVPSSITAAEASAAGQKTIEHSTGLNDAKSDPDKANAVIRVLKRNRTWLCPTLIMRSNYASLDDVRLSRDSRLKYVKPSWRNRWLKMTSDAVNTPANEWSKRKEIIRKEKVLLGLMHKAGVGILAGTDDANPYSLVGFGLHDELAMLVEAGLTPMQALQAATLNPAKFFHRLNLLGTIEKGKLADLVLLNANPLENIRNSQRVDAVVLAGKYLPKEALEQILSQVEAAAKR